MNLSSRCRTSAARRLAIAAAFLALLTACAGCGASADGAGGGTSAASAVCDAKAATAVRKSDTVYIGWPDVTYSTNKTRASYLPDMVTFARMAAKQRSPLLMDAFTGAPENTTDWPVACDFSSTPSALGGNADLERAFLRSQAEKLRPEFRALLNKPGARGGSPLLNLFVLSGYAISSHPGTNACIALFTDAGVLEPGFNVNMMLTPTQQEELVARWAPRLERLRGSKVIVVGVGRGTKLTIEQLEYVRTVLSKLLVRVGAELIAFDTRLSSTVHC